MIETMMKEGFDFSFNPNACESCEGNCCIGESGYIWVTPKEIKDIASFLELDETQFRNTRLRKIRYRYSLKERQVAENFACEFFDMAQKKCTIYKVRPSQCRTFPFWDYFKEHIDEVKKECPGISH